MKQVLKYLNHKIKHNILITTAYKFKFYVDISISQISWVTGKLPELMAFVYLTEKFGVVLSIQNIIYIIISGMIGLFMFGYVWHKTGIYEIEQYTNAERNPVQREILKAAIKINKKR